MQTRRQRFLAVNKDFDQLLEPRVAAAADRAMRAVDAETVSYFVKYGVDMPGDYAVYSTKIQQRGVTDPGLDLKSVM